MRWAKKDAIRTGTYTATQTSDTFRFEPADTEGIYVVAQPNSTDSQWNVNIQMPLLTTGVWTEVAVRDDFAASALAKGIYISEATLQSYLPWMRIILEKDAGATSVDCIVYILSVMD